MAGGCLGGQVRGMLRGMLRAACPLSATPGTQLTREQCQVAVGRMPCVAPQGRDACLQAGCCYDDMDRIAPCYYGNTGRMLSGVSGDAPITDRLSQHLPGWRSGGGGVVADPCCSG